MTTSTELLQRGYVACAPELGNVGWFKSTFSNSQGNCPKFAKIAGGVIGMMDSKDPEGPALILTRDETAGLLSYIKNGGLDDI